MVGATAASGARSYGRRDATGFGRVGVQGPRRRDPQDWSTAAWYSCSPTGASRASSKSRGVAGSTWMATARLFDGVTGGGGGGRGAASSADAGDGRMGLSGGADISAHSAAPGRARHHGLAPGTGGVKVARRTARSAPVLGQRQANNVQHGVGGPEACGCANGRAGGLDLWGAWCLHVAPGAGGPRRLNAGPLRPATVVDRDDEVRFCEAAQGPWPVPSGRRACSTSAMYDSPGPGLWAAGQRSGTCHGRPG